VHVLRRATGTGSAAQNFIQMVLEADITGYDFIALSDHDDIWMPGKIQRAIKRLQVSGAGGYSCSVIARWPDGRESVLRQSAQTRDADYLFEGAGQGCSFVVTPALFAGVQKVFRKRPDLASQLIYHDWAIYALARSQGTSWYFDADPFVIYRQHGNNDTGARSSAAGMKRRLRMFMDGRYGRQVAAINQLCLGVAPQDHLLHRWAELDSKTPVLVRRAAKAVFCLRHGRRRRADRVMTAIAALAGWL
jgi:rhamnosyltransferase